MKTLDLITGGLSTGSPWGNITCGISAFRRFIISKIPIKWIRHKRIPRSIRRYLPIIEWEQYEK